MTDQDFQKCREIRLTIQAELRERAPIIMKVIDGIDAEVKRLDHEWHIAKMENLPELRAYKSALRAVQTRYWAALTSEAQRILANIKTENMASISGGA